MSKNEFWIEISKQYHDGLAEVDPVYILSPKQERAYALALAGIKRASGILKLKAQGRKLCVVPRPLFDEFYLEWYGQGLIKADSLEPRYKKIINQSAKIEDISLDALINRLAVLIDERNFSAEFAAKWSRFQRVLQLRMFLHIFDPYHINEQSLIGNSERRLVERYIYALWLKHHGFTKGKRDKGNLENLLVDKLHQAIDSKKTHLDRKRFYSGLISKRGGLSRTPTNMTFEEIEEFVNDGFFTAKDFPEIFPAP